MPMVSNTSSVQEIEQLKRRLEVLQEEAEEHLRQKLKAARAAVTQVMIPFFLESGRKGVTNAPSIAQRLNQTRLRVRRWIKTHPRKLKREGAGRRTRFLLWLETMRLIRTNLL